MARKGAGWTLEELIDFEFFLGRGVSNQKEVGREMREGMRDAGISDDEIHRRRWGLKYWLFWERTEQEELVGKKVVTACRLVGLLLLVGMFLVGVATVRGLVTGYSYEGGPYQVELEANSTTLFDLSDFSVTAVNGEEASAKGFNVWVLLFATLGIQWLLLLAGFLGFILFRKWASGLKALLGGVIRRFSGGISVSELTAKKSQRAVLSWRLGSILHFGGVGFTDDLLVGLIWIIWFNHVALYWESILRVGAPSLEKATELMSLPWGGDHPSPKQIELTQLRTDSDYRFEDAGMVHSLSARSQADLAWSLFFFLGIAVWGLLPRLFLLFFSVWKERSVLANLDFQDREHRQLWRELSHVERSVTMEGVKDGVVLFDLGGLEISTDAVRPFLLQQLRVNPEGRYQLGVLSETQEEEAWNAMRKAPCGVVILAEGWNLSPKQFTEIWERMRAAAGDDMVIRVVIIGDGDRAEPSAPSADELSNWENFIDGLRDPLMECLSYQPSVGPES